MSTMNNILRRTFLFVALAAVAAAALPQAVLAAQENNVVNGYAVHGYDVVAYFSEGKPVSGKDDFTAQHGGVTYRFASAANRDAFAADPARYAPQYGGFCAFGTAMGRKFDGDPTAWAIVDGKLYLNLNKDVQAKWKENVPGFIKGAENNWPLIRHVADAELEASPPAGVTLGAQ